VQKKTITLDHGSGGVASQELITSLMLNHLPDPRLHRLEDAALLPAQNGRLAFSTDSYVVDPIFFPGGNIGELAVNGTINDLAMQGASPLCLSLGLILEEGLPLDDLETIMAAIGACCEAAGVPVVTGDTKVVPRGKGDRIFINTSGIGVVADGVHIGTDRIREGDAILVSGPVGDHGLTILAAREGIDLGRELQSDTCALHRLVQDLLAEIPAGLHGLRDPTRGGLATTLAEMARAAGLGFEIREEDIPLQGVTRAGCELLGLDPLYLANEGKCILIVEAAAAEAAVVRLRAHTQGRQAACIGRVGGSSPGRVILRTRAGGSRLLEPLFGDPLPRIC